MNPAWMKLRSMMRGPLFVSAGGGPASRSAPPAAPTIASASPLAAGDSSEGAAALRALEAKIEALSQRLSAMAMTTDGTPKGVDAADGRDEWIPDLANLRSADAALAADHAAIRETLARAAEVAAADATKLIHLETTTRTLEEGLAAATLRERDLRQSLEFCEETMRSARQEWLAQAAQRDRELSGRFAGLYVISIVALLLSLGTLVLCLVK